MLLQRVNLKGFLAHRGVQDGDNGTFGRPVELDFRGSSLWLVHGPNGSGKSSIFDAVTFALYNRVRDKGKSFERFINDLCDRADVEVEVQVGEESYLVSRGVGKRGPGKANTSRVHRLTVDGPRIEPGTENDVASWRERTVRLSYENFVCAALLRQGEADSFLKADASERKVQLMKLLDMAVYEKLGEKANKRKTERKARLDMRQSELDTCQPVSDEEMEAAQKRVDSAEEELRTAIKEFEASSDLLRNAEQAAKWLTEIGQKKKHQSQDAVILSDRARIEADAERHRALGEALPRLDAVWRLRDSLDDETKNLDQAQKQRAEVEEAINTLAPDLQRARELKDSAQDAVATVERRKAEVERIKAMLDSNLANLQRIEVLEHQISKAENSMAPLRDTLENADVIEQTFARLRALEEACRKLNPLQKANKKLAQAEQELAYAQETSAAASNALIEARDRLAEREKAGTQLNADIEVVRLKIEEVERRLHVLREKLEHRVNLEHEAECPTCGSELDKPEARARLQLERDRWSQEAEERENESVSLMEQRKVLQSDKAHEASAFKDAQEALREADKRNATAEANVTHAQNRVEEATHERKDALHHAGQYVDRIDEYDSLHAEYERLKSEDIEAQHRTLVEARERSADARKTIEILQGQLRDDLPQWSEAERRALRQQEDSITQQLKEADAAVIREKDARDSALLALEKSESELQKLAGTRERLHGLCEDGARRIRQAEARVQAELATLPAPWNEHPGAHDVEQWKSLFAEFASLEDAPKRAKALGTALEQVKLIDAQIQTLQGYLDELPAAHRVALDVAMDQKKAAEKGQQNAQTERDQARHNMKERERAHEEYAARLAKRDEAERVSSRAEKLARAFGAGGLQAKIASEAQRSISVIANEVLSRLSQGDWQIDLRENKAGTELEIIARDLGRGGKERPFECLSGGERFRVAISLAIAIGQSASGGHSINTLVIDEGFGALDDINRGLLVSELRRLSENVLRGGRIIIVSHQDDVCGEFDFRYRVSRDADGYAQVQRFTPCDV